MGKPHKHAALIKAWADGAVIEVYDDYIGWKEAKQPGWNVTQMYRIKPEPKPYIIDYLFCDTHDIYYEVESAANLKLTFDGETGKLKAAEVI